MFIIIISYENITKNFGNRSVVRKPSQKNTDGGLLKFKVLAFAKIYSNLSVSMIIEKLGIKKSNFALLTAELEREGLLNIEHAEIDRRCRILRLTDKGEQQLQAFYDKTDDYIGATDIDTERAIDILINYLNKRI